MNGKIIVLSGEAGAGKDSVAKALQEHGFEMFSLSEKAKRFVGEVFCWDDERLFGPSSKRNEPDPSWARPCKTCNGKGRYERAEMFGGPSTIETWWDTCEKCEGTGKINDNSARRVLQLLCCEWARDMIHPDIWTMTNRLELGTMLGLGKNIVINDARYKNDRNNLHEWFGAKRVHVTASRPKKDQDADWRKHQSENDQPSAHDIDYTIDNGDEKWPFPGMTDRIMRMLVKLYVVA